MDWSLIGKTLLETVVHAFPSSVIDAMVRSDVLQIVAFSVLFAMAVSAVGEKGKPIVRAMRSLSQVMFKFTNYVMMFAPIRRRETGSCVSAGSRLLTTHAKRARSPESLRDYFALVRSA